MSRRDFWVCVLLGEFSAFLLYGLARVWGLPGWLLSLFPVALLAGPVSAASLVWLGTRFGRENPAFPSLAKFLTVGTMNTLIDFGILNLLLILTAVVTAPLFALFKGFSFSVAVVSSYLWNRNWSFADIKGKGAARLGERREFARFAVVTLASLATNTGVATLLVQVGSPVEYLSPLAWANVSAAVALILSTTLNFLGYRWLVFGPSRLALTEALASFISSPPTRGLAGRTAR